MFCILKKIGSAFKARNLKFSNNFFMNRYPSRSSVYKAIKWVRNNSGETGVNITNKNKVAYPEVTGYFIPTLILWGEKDLAKALLSWLITQQNPDGSFSAPDGIPYTFDTGQVLRGFVKALDGTPEIERPLRMLCDWILIQIQSDGRMITPSTKMWGTVADERIHLYVLPPLVEAGKKLGEEKYLRAAQKVLNFYKNREDIIEFNTLSHFYAYIIEALCDLGEIDLAKKAMKQVAEIQKRDGSVPAYANVSWVCSTGVAQFAVIWYKLGMKENADNAIYYLENIQNPEGGFFGSYGRGKNYFPNEEISWANKFFLDAYYWKIRKNFDALVDQFSDSINNDDGRVKELIFYFGDLSGKKVIDIGCGKGRYLTILQKLYPKSHLFGIDISEKMLEYLPVGIETKLGSILDIQYPDNYFDCVYSVETLEHTILPENAIKEMTRILKPGGKIVIIDKNKEKLGALKLEVWEQWFKPEDIVNLLQKCGVKINYKYIQHMQHMQNCQVEGLFIAWEGVKRDIPVL